MDIEWGVTAATALVAAGMLGFFVVGILAYAGRWGRLRLRMILVPEGHRLAGGLWLSLLALPIAVLVLVESPDRDRQPST